MEQKITAFYNGQKILIDLIGFTAVVCALFLQIQGFGGSPLRFIQFLLLVLLSLEITYFIISFWIIFFINIKETGISRSLSSVFGTVILVFLFNLYRFTYETFTTEFWSYLKYLTFPLLLLAYTIGDKYFVERSKNELKRKLKLIFIDILHTYFVNFVLILSLDNLAKSLSLNFYIYLFFTQSLYVILGAFHLFGFISNREKIFLQILTSIAFAAGLFLKLY